MEFQQLLSLGIGGAIAGVVLFWKRSDDKSYSSALTEQAKQLIELNKLTLEVVSKNTAALVEVTSGRVLMTEFGQDDYVMAESLDYVGRISYPRLYYRNFMFAGPFTVVDGDPQKALGEQAFNGAADQLGMKLRMRLSPEPPAG